MHMQYHSPVRSFDLRPPFALRKVILLKRSLVALVGVLVASFSVERAGPTCWCMLHTLFFDGGLAVCFGLKIRARHRVITAIG